MIYEQWNSEMPLAGLNGWLFDDMSPDIDTLPPIQGQGSFCLTTWNANGTVGRCYLGSAYTLTDTVYKWRCYSESNSRVYLMLGTDSNGTMLGAACTNGGNGFCWSTWYGTTQLTLSETAGTSQGPIWADAIVNYDSGTWYGTLYDSEGGTRTYTYGSAFVPEDTVVPEFRNGSNNAVGTTGITNLEYPVAPPQSIFDYFGTFNLGYNWGWLNLGPHVMSIAPITERLYEPNTTRGWMSQTSVMMDDTLGTWSGLIAKYFGGQGPVWNEGTFHVRQTWDDGSTYLNMLTGYSSSDQVTYNDGNKIATIPVNNMIGKLAQQTIPYDPQLIGTVSDLTDGTVTVSGTGSHWDLYEKEQIWRGTDAGLPSIRISSLPDGGTWSGTGPYSAKFYVREEPSWLIANASVYRSQSGDRWDAGYPTIAEVLTEMGMTGGFDADDTEWAGLYSLGTEMVRYYGGEPWIDVLHDWCACHGAAFTMLPNAGGRTWYTKWYMPKPEYNSYDGTLNRNEAINDEYTIRYTKALDKVQVQAAWDSDEERYDAQVESGEDGNNLSIDAKWLKSDRFAKALADHTRALGVTNRMQTLVYDGTTWNDILAGNTYSKVSTNTNWGVVTSRTYDYATDTASYELMEIATKGILRWDESVWDGSDEWW